MRCVIKVHAITTSGGTVKAFEMTSANVDDRIALEDLSSVTKSGSVIIGDKGYVCEPLAEKLQAQGQKLLALKRKNVRKLYPLKLQQEIFRRRRGIETTFKSELSLMIYQQYQTTEKFLDLLSSE